MKNSKFIQSSKDKLSRSFNPSKCKTSLRMAASRSKLLRNRKENPLKQMKKETAQLLLSGQDQVALIRVEHVIKEEKMIAAFELIEIYCELIIARLPRIESQKNCPIDLKEAIASIVFASPRCRDVPELLDVRKQFTAKYGKDFTAAAIELRPTCGVSRLMVEKLSASAPDAQTKIKILSAIAEEHNVKWDHKPVEEKDLVPPNDLLGGPSTFGSASQPYVEPSRYSPDVQAPQSNTLHGSQSNPSRQDTKTSPQTDNLTPSQTSGSNTYYQRNESPPHRQSQPYVEPSRYYPDSQDPQINMLRETQSNSSHQDSKTSPHIAKLTPSQTSSSSTCFQRNESPPHRQSQPYVPSHYSPDAKAPQINTMHDSQSNSSHQDTKTSPQTENFTPSQASSSSTSFYPKEIPPNRQSLTMDFMDATSAAKAAAESAEHASVAAKAAAELANGSRIMRQNSSESRKSEVYVKKDEVPESYLITKKTSENISEERVDSLYAEDTRLQNEKIVEDRIKTSGLVGNGRSGLKDYSQSVSLNSKISIEEDLLDHSVPVQDAYSQNDSLKHEAESPNEWPEGSEIVREERVSKKQSFKSSGSNSSVSDDLNTSAKSEHPKFDCDADNDNFVNGDVVGEDSASVHFDDKFDSDGDYHGFNFGTKYDEPESEFHLPLPSHKSTGLSSKINSSYDPEYSSSKIVDSTSSLFTTENSSTEFSENLTSEKDLEQDNLKSVASDDVDGPVSESDEEIITFNSKPNQSGKLKDECGSTFEEEDYSVIHKEHLSLSSNHECEGMRTSQEKSSYVDSPEELSSKNSRVDVAEPNDFAAELDTDSAVGLNFGKLTGGLKHKGYNNPLFLKNQLGGSSPPKEENNSSTVISTVQSSVENPMAIRSKIVDKKNRTRTTAPERDSDIDSSVEEVSPRKGSDQKFKIQELGAGTEIKTNLDMGSSNLILGSDNSVDENSRNEPLPRKNHLRGGMSRRTKPSSRNSETSTNFKTRLRSEALASDYDMDRKPKSSYISDIPEEFEPKKQETSLKSEALASDDDMDREPQSSYISDIPEEFEPNNKQEMCLKSEALASDDDLDRKPKSSYIADIPKESEPKNKQETSEQSASPKLASKPARSNFWGPPEPYAYKTTPVTKQEAKAQVRDAESDTDAVGEREPNNHSTPNHSNSSAVKESSCTLVSTESPKAGIPNKTDSKDDGSKRASHVHPKLPDYDSLLQSLRANRS